MVRQLSGSGEGAGQDRVLSQRRGDLGDGDQDQPLTATVTATAAANRLQQRPAAAHNSRTIRANWEYVRPEKRKVFQRRRPTENLVDALPARAPEMPPNCHQQPTIATGSHLRT